MMDEWNRNGSLRPDPAAFDRNAKEQARGQALEQAKQRAQEQAKQRALEQAQRRRERMEKRKAALDDELDRGLEDTFPGSDPVAVTQPPHSARDKYKH